MNETKILDRRRSPWWLVLSLTALCLCIFTWAKSISLFSHSDSTTNQTQSIVEESPLISPPQFRKADGTLTCTKNRYIKHERQIGVASYYGDGFHGKKTASGTIFNKYENTVAHLTLPMGTEVLVENPKTGTRLHATVTDCGPYKPGRIVDLSEGLADKLGIKLGPVIITVL